MSHDFLQKQCIGFLNTPPLWHKAQFGIQQFDFPKVDLLEFEPESIPKNIRLGHQMEYVFKQLLSHSRAYKIILHNLTVKDGNRTVGEIDFILQDLKTNEHVHVELTYKFYIIDSKISEPVHRLMGPNRRDMFFTKMEKIKNNQFKLLHSTIGINILYNKGLNHKKISHQACYKAQLFVPYGDNKNAHIRPLNKNCICGYWLRFDDFNTSEFKSYRFYIPYKTEWVVAPHSEVQWRNHFDTLIDVNLRMLKENSPMVWMKKSETEFEKFFVVWW